MIYIEDFFKQIINKEISPIYINPTDNEIFQLFQEQQIPSQELMIVLEELLYNSEEHGKNPICLYF